ncbi:MAG TPA: amidohydrolase family protein [Casimicrobiaceae bacterium]|nr:amidohydrolase family protein [Casimicrobiaceae bacterium]
MKRTIYYRNDPDGRRLPIKLDAATNGEFAPIPLAREHFHANQLAFDVAAFNAKRLSLTRRAFLASSCGAAATLLAMNAAYAARGRRGGYFELPVEAALDEGLAATTLARAEFIFDVQGHFVDPTGAWTRALPAGAQPLRFATDRASCSSASAPGIASLRCLDSEAFIKDVFLDSDTDLVVLSFVPSTRKGEPLTIEEAAATARIVERMEGTHRLLLHGRVNPNQEGDLEGMDELAARYPIAAWKTYTQWGPDGRGFFLDDEPGLAMIAKARKLGIRNVAVHKGLPFGPESYGHSTCVDVGRVARSFPDVNFLIYHSGFVPGAPEGPYDPQRSDGIDALITSLQENNVRPGANVYAELGSTWRFLMRDPDSAAHALGKLLKYVGPDNVLWGTDSIWYGSPQDQIQAFRTFQISAEFAAKHGYPRITPTLRAKVFGRNALRVYKIPEDVLKKHLAADKVTRERLAYAERADPAFLTYGPKTRREFLNLKARGG